ncbi:MAG: PAS domain-containing protein [Marivivens sp.]|jgi:PAS domain-containing protein|uniref:PAS-domain containing protein n=1 Tax=Marivivens sp. TaxID=1978374 RepID=UPI002313FF8A|nr:PAS-domain containing protein [Marivivens sp.]MCL7404550.1 PAS-domain containing protein [Marivivens geojensis]NBX08908.1 PAS domain-containing protein [Marivivens sp.]
MSGMYLFGLCLISVAAAGLIISVLARFLDQKNQSTRAMIREAEDEIVFLFDETKLIDATPSAKALLRRRATEKTDWDRFLGFFASNFPQIRTTMSSIQSGGSKMLTSPSDPDLRLDVELCDGIIRVTYQEGFRRRTAVDIATLTSIEDELHTLRGIAESAPQLIWKQDDTGTITWANRSYLDLAALVAGYAETEIPPWPPAELFSKLDTQDDLIPTRHSIDLGTGRSPKWFEVTKAHRNAETIHFAVDVTKVTKAEETQRSYVQTLVKTFAQLSVGLAIFNSDRELIVFNPALHDLTEIPADFLASRPKLHTFFDRLRDQKNIHVAADQRSWRDQIVSLEKEAKAGRYSVNWELSNGQVYRFVGRPHPDGALAFLVEDVTSEISLTRRFEAQIETGQAVMDSLDDAIAVFSAAGIMIMSNQSYHQLWNYTKTAPFVGSTLLDESRFWQDASAPTPIWTRLREDGGLSRSSQVWSDTIRHNDGRLLECSTRPMPNGATLVRFRHTGDSKSGREAVIALWAAQG